MPAKTVCVIKQTPQAANPENIIANFTICHRKHICIGTAQNVLTSHRPSGKLLKLRMHLIKKKTVDSATGFVQHLFVGGYKDKMGKKICICSVSTPLYLCLNGEVKL